MKFKEYLKEKEVWDSYLKTLGWKEQGEKLRKNDPRKFKHYKDFNKIDNILMI